MAWNNLALEAGTSLIQNGASFILANKKAKSDRAWQAWRNKMVRVANAQNQNTITANVNLATQRSAMQEEAIRKSERLTLAATEVAAAATGTRGNSVAQTLRDVSNNAAAANTRRLMDLDVQMLTFKSQSENSNLQAVQQTEYNPIPSPSGASDLLNFGKDITELWGKYKPEIKNKLGGS